MDPICSVEALAITTSRSYRHKSACCAWSGCKVYLLTFFSKCHSIRFIEWHWIRFIEWHFGWGWRLHQVYIHPEWLTTACPPTSTSRLLSKSSPCPLEPTPWALCFFPPAHNVWTFDWWPQHTCSLRSGGNVLLMSRTGTAAKSSLIRQRNPPRRKIQNYGSYTHNRRAEQQLLTSTNYWQEHGVFPDRSTF